VTKTWVRLSLAAVAVTAFASVGFACDKHADAKDAQAIPDDKAAVAKDDSTGCDMPCCAHAKAAADDKVAANAAGEKPCAAGVAKGCAKKATATVAAKTEPAKEPAKAELAKEPAKAEPAKEQAKTELAPSSGTHR
jgi:hypothetical protein